MTKPHYISSLCFLLIALAVLTSCGAERNMKKGEKYLALGEYFDAANEFKQAYQKIPPKQRDKRGVAAGKMALCYDKSLQTAKGIAAYRNVIRYNQAKTQDHLSLAQLLMKTAVTRRPRPSSNSCSTPCPTTYWRARDWNRPRTRPPSRNRAADTP